MEASTTGEPERSWTVIDHPFRSDPNDANHLLGLPGQGFLVEEGTASGTLDSLHP